MTSTPAYATSPVPVAPRQRRDPVLAELWEIKAQMNAQAGYDVRLLLENAHQQVLAMRAAGLLVTREAIQCLNGKSFLFNNHIVTSLSKNEDFCDGSRLAVPDKSI